MTAVRGRTPVPGRTAVPRGTAVPMLQALSWGAESPLGRSGEVDIEALAHGLARSDYPGGRRRQPYTRAQHAVVVSEAVETLAGLRLPERRVLAMHAWLAEVRDAELRDKKRTRVQESNKRLALRTIDLEALADVLARTSRWDNSVAPAAAAVDESLKLLGGLGAEYGRRLSLYALLAETVLAGLGTAVAEAALKAAGLAREAPESWVHILRFVRRMADAAVRRDLQGPNFGEESSFPAMKKRIELLEPEKAAQRWLARYRALITVREKVKI